MGNYVQNWMFYSKGIANSYCILNDTMIQMFIVVI